MERDKDSRGELEGELQFNDLSKFSARGTVYNEDDEIAR